jgi:outer membrane receptor for ferrienterochelin and colicins
MPRPVVLRLPSSGAWRIGVVVLSAAAGMPAGTRAQALSADPVPVPGTPAEAGAMPAVPTAPGAKLDKVEITGGRVDDVQERRQSTAAKIIIGREEIERFGDSTLGEVLKRLPGVTIQGRPGRGGAIRLRGLGSGYTQILLDGERVPPGFSLDSLAPEQIERIEILRAPTAETGARAIAGTINIITRGGYTKRINDVRLATAVENGRLQPSVSWTRNDSVGPFIYNYSLSAFRQNRASDTTTTTVDQDLSSGAITLDQRDVGTVREHRQGLHATGRLQWRGAEDGHSLTLIPLVIYGTGTSKRTGALEQTVGATPPPYDTSTTDGDGSYLLTRLNAQWNRRIGDAARLESRAGIGLTRNETHSLRFERTGGALSRTLEDTADTRDRHLSASEKLIAQVGAEHSVVAGAEAEANRRHDTRTTLQDGAPLLVDFGDNLTASSTRFALYAQDEWNLTPNWAAHAGLRWEGISTRGTGEAGQPESSNRSSVWSPLLHAVWKPDPKGRDQVRISLTRSYRSPTLGNLIARPSINTRYPAPGPNTPTQPDRAGNPSLRPELASGIDIAIERYLPTSGILSANVFQRRISNYMRSQVALETVPWANQPRYVSRPQNIGNALTQGIELEAKFRLSDLVSDAPRIDLRSNASIFRSRVKSVPGPDNRLDQQPDYTANLGADYRFAGLLTLGGNLNWTPGYTTRISDEQTALQGRKLILDAYALWVFSPQMQLRISASNLDPRDYVTGGTFDDAGVRETSNTTAPTSLNLQIRLELKL